MSIYDVISLQSDSVEKTHSIAKNLVKTLYKKPLILLLKGELGAGKTTFSQGLSSGLGVVDRITSPTFALENTYNDILSHIDLYRLQEAEAEQFMHHLPPFSGVRLIEWPTRVNNSIFKDERHIIVQIDEQSATDRHITIEFHDCAIPSTDLRKQWKEEIGILPNIIEHMDQVTYVAKTCANTLIQNGQPVRTEALTAAAELHDLFRFVDFKDNSVVGHKINEDQQRKWEQLKNRYGTIHEEAAAAFLTEKGFPTIADIVISHGSPKYGHTPLTIEQKILTYSDKRVRHTDIVTVDERFDDFVVRYSNGKETDFAKQWRQSMKELEAELFETNIPRIL